MNLIMPCVPIPKYCKIKFHWKPQPSSIFKFSWLNSFFEFLVCWRHGIEIIGIDCDENNGKNFCWEKNNLNKMQNSNREINEIKHYFPSWLPRRNSNNRGNWKKFIQILFSKHLLAFQVFLFINCFCSKLIPKILQIIKKEKKNKIARHHTSLTKHNKWNNKYACVSNAKHIHIMQCDWALPIL